MNKKNILESDILEAIKDSMGLKSVIAKKLDCDITTLNRYLTETCIQAINEEREKNIDLAEKVVMGSIQDNDVQTAKWYLSTIGKYRGFTTQNDISVSGSLQINIDTKYLPDLNKNESE